MRRHLVGLLAIVLFLGAVAFFIWPPTGRWENEYHAVCLRVGLFCAIWWLAWPQAARMPRWFWFVVPLLILTAIFRARLLLVIIPALLVIGVLSVPWRRGKQRPRP
jgi:hypothetical protein